MSRALGELMDRLARVEIDLVTVRREVADLEARLVAMEERLADPALPDSEAEVATAMLGVYSEARGRLHTVASERGRVERERRLLERRLRLGRVRRGD